jgi:hypothetical protein
VELSFSELVGPFWASTGKFDQLGTQTVQFPDQASDEPWERFRTKVGGFQESESILMGFGSFSPAPGSPSNFNGDSTGGKVAQNQE